MQVHPQDKNTRFKVKFGLLCKRVWVNKYLSVKLFRPIRDARMDGDLPCVGTFIVDMLISTVG